MGVLALGWRTVATRSPFDGFPGGIDADGGAGDEAQPVEQEGREEDCGRREATRRGIRARRQHQGS